jgi:hypothetical protein
VGTQPAEASCPTVNGASTPPCGQMRDFALAKGSDKLALRSPAQEKSSSWVVWLRGATGDDPIGRANSLCQEQSPARGGADQPLRLTVWSLNGSIRPGQGVNS